MVNNFMNKVRYNVEWNRENKEKRKLIQQRHYQKHRQEYIKHAKEYRWKLKVETIKAYGEKCTCCGEKHIEFLAIDHINGGGDKERRKNRTIQTHKFYLWLRKRNNPKGYQVLCHNCNMAKSHFGGCPHRR